MDAYRFSGYTYAGIESTEKVMDLDRKIKESIANKQPLQFDFLQSTSIDPQVAMLFLLKAHFGPAHAKIMYVVFEMLNGAKLGDLAKFNEHEQEVLVTRMEKFVLTAHNQIPLNVFIREHETNRIVKLDAARGPELLQQAQDSGDDSIVNLIKLTQVP